MKGGRRPQAPAGTPHANLLVDIVNKFGVPLQAHGVSNGRLGDLMKPECGKLRGVGRWCLLVVAAAAVVTIRLSAAATDAEIRAI